MAHYLQVVIAILVYLSFGLPLKTRHQLTDGTSPETLRPSEVVETALRHASVGVRYELV